VALIVQKYGGTSMGSVERIREVAKRVARFVREGHKLIVVPSAMAGETNRLLGLARDLSPDPSPRARMARAALAASRTRHASRVAGGSASAYSARKRST